MANINSTQLNDILKDETVFVESENKVYQWVDNVTPWGVIAEGTTVEGGDVFKASNNELAPQTKVVKLDAGSAKSGAFVSAGAIATSNPALLGNLEKLDETNARTGIATIGGHVFERNFAGLINGVEYTHTAPNSRISDSEDLSIGGAQIVGSKSDNEFHILLSDATVVIDNYYGSASNAGPNVPVNTVFKLNNTVGFDPYEGANPAVSGVKAGFYKTANNAVDLSQADAFKTLLGTDILLAGDGSEDLSSPAKRAAASPKTSSKELGDDSSVSVSTEVAAELAHPQADDAGSFPTKFWGRLIPFENPIASNGAVQAGFTNENAASLAAGTYWNIISSGLAQDIADGNSAMWTETPVLEASDALKYRE